MAWNQEAIQMDATAHKALNVDPLIVIFTYAHQVVSLVIRMAHIPQTVIALMLRNVPLENVQAISASMYSLGGLT